MRRKIIYIILCISVFTNIYQFVQPRYNKSSLQQEETSITSTPMDSIKSDDSTDYLNCIFMNNPIDQYFLKQLNNQKSEMDYETIQETYMNVWKQQYKIILDILKKKCIYDDDKDIFSQYSDCPEKIYEYSKNALTTVMLDSFSIEPGNPAKESYGLGTIEGLKMYQGMFYRNCCMIFIPYLENDYSFPTNESLDSVIQDNLGK